MRKIEDNEYFLLKALSQSVIDGILPALERTTKSCEKFILEIEEIDKKIENAESGAEINQYSREFETKRVALVRLLALKNRMNLLIERNKNRIKFIEKILADSGLYNSAFDKKKITEIEKQEESNISEETLNINVFEEDGEVVENKYFKGEIVCIRGGILDFSNEINTMLLKTASEEFLVDLVCEFPQSVANIPVEVLVDTSVKKRILKAVATYVVDETKKKDIKSVNKSLGNLLEFKTQITSTPEDYIAGVTNMFNVQVKNFLIENNPQKADELKDKLKCNEKSELIPESKRIAVLSGGLAGEITAEEQSEEERLEEEKELNSNAANNAFLEVVKEQEEEQEILKELEEIEREAKRSKEQEEALLKRQKKLEEEEQQKKEAEQSEQMVRAMTNNRYDD